MKIKYFVLFLLISFYGINAQSIQQKLTIIQNDQVQDGIFKIGMDIKGINLPVARTIGSFTIDLFVDSTLLMYESSAQWKFGSANGYSRFVNRVRNTVRIGCTSMGVNENGGGDPAGYNILNDVYDTWVELTFRIVNPTENASITINRVTNAIGIFQNLNNNPRNGVIFNQTLPEPIEIGSVPLPVELISFTGKKVGNEIQLNWKTATEKNNYGFEIERAILTGQNKEWQKIGFLNGNGNSNSTNEYYFSDKKVSNFNYVYRLKQIDNDGSFNYSNEVLINNIIIPVTAELYQNYPNPFNPSTIISFALPNESNIKISLYNTLGEKVTEILEGKYGMGVHQINFDASKLSAGTYLYVLEANDFRISKKLILIK
ncbi:MAG TPA: T9SS type A sorting domain-containing protein [Ignavibacteriaceae bacterium]|nr:T9SS type A sorting domain-containing protein [Ignavibacteriaceae bacterium]